MRIVFTSRELKPYFLFRAREDLVSWESKRGGRHHALVTFATVDGSKRALQASSVKTMYGDLGIVKPSPDMWKFLDPTSSNSTRHMPVTAMPPGKGEKGASDSIHISPVLVAMEKRMKEIERSLADSRQSGAASIKSIEENLRDLKERFDKVSDNGHDSECCTTAKNGNRNTTCRESRIPPEANLHLLRLFSIMMEELKRRPTS